MRVPLAFSILALARGALAAQDPPAWPVALEQAAIGASPAGPDGGAGAQGVPVAARDASRPPEDRPPVLGLSLDGGFPDGVAISALFRPVRPLRLDGGITYNLIGFGLRGGLTFVPFRSAVAPVLRGEFGHTFQGDATGLVGHFTTLTPGEQLVLRDVSYDYASVQLGLELGASDRLVFFARGGLAWFWTTARNFQAAARLDNPNVSEAADPNVHGTVPTATLGLLFYFW